MQRAPEFKPYPIEIAFPDISRFQSSSTGIDYVHTFDSGKPGPHAVINALTHGNEVCGAIAVGDLLERKPTPVRGKLTLSFANVEAYKRFDPSRPDASRFVEEDFNRLWSPAVLDGPRDSVELRRAREMRPIFDQADFLLDLHSMHEAAAPLLVSGNLDKGISFAGSLGCDACIVADEGHAEGRRLRDYAGFGDPSSPRNALLVECGQHWQAQAVTVARDSIARFLRALDILEQGALDDWIAGANAPPMLVRVTDPVVAKTYGFRFTADYRGLEKFEKKGTLIGTDGDTEVRTPYDDCVLVMPSLRQLRPGVTVVRLGRMEAMK